METKFKIGNLVTLSSDKNAEKKIYKIVEIWEAGYIAFSKGKAPSQSKYVVSCFEDYTATAVDENELSHVIMPGTEDEHIA